jgi:LPXTG-site transpeptidase (sortase) family protein
MRDEQSENLTEARTANRVARSPRVLLERVLTIVGIVCLAYYAYQTAEARNFQREQTRAFEALLQESAAGQQSTATRAGEEVDRSDELSPAAESSSSARRESRPVVARRRELPNPDASARATAHAKLSGVFALLDIPRLKVSSPVVAGDAGGVLKVAVGHLPDTPKPWEPGNSAFAAHRDGLFRPLRNVRVGDEVRVRTERGDFVYRVVDTRIVEPTDLSVLASTATPSLTLITCYPFNLVGDAPQRFIVHAERVADWDSTQ